MINNHIVHYSITTSVLYLKAISKVALIKKAYLNSYYAFVLTGIFLCCGNAALAETEPNNTPETANVLALNTTETGSVGSGDTDYFMVTNSTNSNFIQLDFEFNGSGPDTLWMKVYGPNSSTNELSSQLTGSGTIETRYKASYTITNAVAGASYFVYIAKQSADGTKTYNLTATGSDAIISPRAKTAMKGGETYSIAVTSSTSWWLMY